MLNGKFFTGLPPKMIDRNAANRNRQESHFFWPDDTQAEPAKPARLQRRSSFHHDMATQRPTLAKQNSLTNDQDEIDTKSRFQKEFAKSSIQFYDNLQSSEVGTQSQRQRNRNSFKLTEKPNAMKLEMPEDQNDDFASLKKKETFASKIKFFDFIEEEPENAVVQRNNLKRMDVNDKREMEKNSKNSPKLQSKKEVVGIKKDNAKDREVLEEKKRNDFEANGFYREPRRLQNNFVKGKFSSTINLNDNGYANFERFASSENFQRDSPFGWPPRDRQRFLRAQSEDPCSDLNNKHEGLSNEPEEDEEPQQNSQRYRNYKNYNNSYKNSAEALDELEHLDMSRDEDFRNHFNYGKPNSNERASANRNMPNMKAGNHQRQQQSHKNNYNNHYNSNNSNRYRNNNNSNHYNNNNNNNNNKSNINTFSNNSKYRRNAADDLEQMNEPRYMETGYYDYHHTSSHSYSNNNSNNSYDSDDNHDTNDNHNNHHYTTNKYNNRQRNQNENQRSENPKYNHNRRPLSNHNKHHQYYPDHDDHTDDDHHQYNNESTSSMESANRASPKTASTLVTSVPKHLRSSLYFNDGAIVAHATTPPTGNSDKQMRRNARNSATQRVSVGLPEFL